jgi:hypothetical protein
MPNWCNNELTIKGRKSEIERFLRVVRTTHSRFDFNTISPEPETLETGKEIEKCYQWRDKNWGTNHLIDERTLWISPGSISPDACQFEIELCFDTAWTPPIPVVLEASKRFPKLEFDLEYYELDGTFFEGVYQVKNGINLMERHGLIDFNAI